MSADNDSEKSKKISRREFLVWAGDKIKKRASDAASFGVGAGVSLSAFPPLFREFLPSLWPSFVEINEPFDANSRVIETYRKGITEKVEIADIEGHTVVSFRSVPAWLYLPQIGVQGLLKEVDQKERVAYYYHRTPNNIAAVLFLSSDIPDLGSDKSPIYPFIDPTRSDSEQQLWLNIKGEVKLMGGAVGGPEKLVSDSLIWVAPHNEPFNPGDWFGRVQVKFDQKTYSYQRLIDQAGKGWVNFREPIELLQN